MKRREISERILKLIGSRNFRPQSIEQLAEQLSLPASDSAVLRQVVDDLAEQGLIVLGPRRRVKLPGPRSQMTGVYRANPRGFGFVKPDIATDQGDIFIPPHQQLNAVSGDQVRIQISKKGKRGGTMTYEGRVIEIIERRRNRFVGRLGRTGGRWCVWPEGKTLHEPVFVDDASSRAPSGALVVVELTQYPSPDLEAQGVIVEVLGQAGDPGVDTLAIIHQYGIPHEMPTECLDAAGELARGFQETHSPPGREDLRDEVILTIDPQDAKDFDDAISLHHDNGVWRLGVHIADVSNFVPPDSALDREARRRGNSVYFPGHVLPMLPEALSNGVCSLQPGRLRLTKSAFITYNSEGEVVDERLANTVIRSQRRLTYEEASGILEGRTGGFEPEIIELMQRMDRLARLIQKRRRREGMLTLDLPEAELVLDERGQVINVVPEDQSFSHTIIEMFMVEANEAAARLLTRLKVPHLRRIHPEPDPLALRNLRKFLAIMGLTLPDNPDPMALQALLDQVRGTPQSGAVNMAVLRSMQTAEYAPYDVGHYALASRAYCHFTSPIRRYPDLTIHRLLELHAQGLLEGDEPPAEAPAQEELVELGRHCSSTERRAEEAERELKTVKILRFLSDRVGDNFRAVISGITEFGFFCQLTEYLIEGLARFEDMTDQWWEVDSAAACAVEQRRGTRLKLGDPVKVSIARIDLAARELNLELVELPAGRGRSTAGKPQKPTRGRGAGSRRKTAPKRAARRSSKRAQRSKRRR